jgi:uncharacterized protein YjdB
VHIQGLGWQAPNKDGEIAGTTGQGRAIEAIKINITKDGTKESSKVAAIRTRGID